MINNIVGGTNIAVTGGSTFMPYVNMSNPSAGMLRYNGSNQCIETYDGAGWLQIASNSACIELTGSANAVISWAMVKMAEEAALQRMASDHPSVKLAYENMKKAAEQLKATIILSKKHEQTTS
jgi:hypothetical protein